MRSLLLSGVLIGACLHASGASAQTGDAVSPAVSAVTPSTRVFKAAVNLVALSVTVTDAQEHHVPGLSSGDFAVFENGVPQDLAFFAAESTPLDLAILLDTSASMRDTLRTAQDAAVLLAQALRPGDRASFIEVKRNARTLHPLSADFNGLELAIRATEANGSTAIYEAVYIALSELSRAAMPGEVRRQAMVILSDGDDTASLVPFDDVLETAKRSGVAIYCVSLRPASPDADGGGWGSAGRGGAGWASRAAVRDGNRVDGDFVLQAFATQTGGRAYFRLDATRDLARTCRAIAQELSSQYSLGYVSTDPREDGEFRQVQVRMRHPADARARTRPGYYATHHHTMTRRPAARPQEGVTAQ